MKTKWIVGILAALALFAVVGGVAFAADTVLRKGTLGKVTDIQGSTLIVENPFGTFNVKTDENTEFQIRGVETPAISDIQVDNMVAGEIEEQADGTYLAKKLIVLALRQNKPARGAGTVTAVGENTLTVQRRNGDEATLFVDEDTVIKIRGIENSTLADINKGDKITARVEKQDDGSLLAKTINVLPPVRNRLRGLGEVTAIGGDSLTVETLKGETLTIAIDKETRFRVKDVEEPTLDDVQVGDTVAGIVVKQEDESLLAKLVAVVPPEGERGGGGLGKVTAVGEDSLTVAKLRGDEVTIFVDENTQYRVPDVEEPTLADIHIDDIVMGRVIEQDDSALLALVVAVVPSKVDRLRGVGEVTAIEGTTLIVTTRDESSVEVLTDANTVFRQAGQEIGFEDIAVGDKLAGQLIRQDDDTLLAKVIVVFPKSK